MKVILLSPGVPGRSAQSPTESGGTAVPTLRSPVRSEEVRGRERSLSIGVIPGDL